MRSLSRSLTLATLATLTLLVTAAFADPQILRFQLQPLCNKITLAVGLSSTSSVVPISGWDDNCGENPRAPLYGTVIVHQNGSLSIGFTTSLPYSVYGRTDVGLQTNVEWPAGSDVGFWRDDDGYEGTFVFDTLDQPSG